MGAHENSLLVCGAEVWIRSVIAKIFNYNISNMASNLDRGISVLNKSSLGYSYLFHLTPTSPYEVLLNLSNQRKVRMASITPRHLSLEDLSVF